MLKTDRYRTIIFLIMVLLVTEKAHSQVKFGLKGGISVSTVTFKTTASNAHNLLAFNTGVISTIELNEKLFFKPELLFSRKGWKFEGGGMDMNYLTMPLLLGYQPLAKLSFHAGPELGYLLNYVRTPAPTPQMSFKKFDYGISFGGGYKLSRFLEIEARYVYGFYTLMELMINTSPSPTVPPGSYIDGANRVLQINLIYFFKQGEL